MSPVGGRCQHLCIVGPPGIEPGQIAYQTIKGKPARAVPIVRLSEPSRMSNFLGYRRPVYLCWPEAEGIMGFPSD